jgi:hypothetical protein
MTISTNEKILIKIIILSNDETIIESDSDTIESWLMLLKQVKVFKLTISRIAWN